MEKPKRPKATKLESLQKTWKATTEEERRAFLAGLASQQDGASLLRELVSGSAEGTGAPGPSADEGVEDAGRPARWAMINPPSQ